VTECDAYRPSMAVARKAPRSRRVLLQLLPAGLVVTVLLIFYSAIQLQLPTETEVVPGREWEKLWKAPPTAAFCARQALPLVCAHGGDPQAAPPNTLAAFRAAATARYGCIEVDVVLSADGVLVALHDRELQQLFRFSGIDMPARTQVGDLTAEELSALEWASGDHVMQAVDVIRAVQASVDVVILDVKTYNDHLGRALNEELIAYHVVQLVEETRCRKCLVWAKSDAVVARVNALLAGLSLPGVRTGHVVMNFTMEARQEGMDVPLRRGLKTNVAAVSHQMVDRALLEKLHRADRSLYSWTADTPEVMQRLLDEGVDAIVTGRPKLLKRAIDLRAQRCALKTEM